MRCVDNSSAAARLALTSVGVALALASTSLPADARGRHAHGGRPARHIASRHAPSRPSGAVPGANGGAYAALVVDANTGRPLYAVNENALRHPASITKVMTLYLLFEKLQNGQMSLATPLTVSRHAASQSPTKLGLRPGSTITVENAIKAIVTRSANDMAVAVAEAVGGDESTFAGLMTRKAHALGMSRTTYVNASGLPDDRQITTARDLTILGRAIQDHFPTYYKFFSTTSFTYAGEVIANHNHLMSRVEGMDGIKTGYTNASGFNLLSNVRRDGHHIVAVVMGGHTAASRDHIMEGLIAENIEGAAPTRTAEAIEDRSTEEPADTVSDAETAHTPDVPHDTSPSLIAPTMAVPPAPPMRQAAVAKARPAFVAGATREPDRATGTGASPTAVADGSTSGRVAAVSQPAATATPSSLRWVAGPQPAAARAKIAERAPPLVRPAPVEMADSTGSIHEPPRDTRGTGREGDAAPSGRGEWKIQIGATPSANEASELLNRARTQSRVALGAARPMTERVQKGSSTLYRARFAGLAPEQAEAACKSLKRSGFACFTTRD